MSLSATSADTWQLWTSHWLGCSSREEILVNNNLPCKGCWVWDVLIYSRSEINSELSFFLSNHTNNEHKLKCYMLKCMYVNSKLIEFSPTMLSSVKKTYLHHMFVYSQSCNKRGWVSLVWGVISKGLFTWRGRWHQNCVRQGSISKADHSWYREINRITGNYRLPQKEMRS